MRSEPEYIWEVDEIIQHRAVQFVETFSDLSGERLPRPAPENAEAFWMASSEWKVVGRCVRIGFDDSIRPIRHYHWAIDMDARPPPVIRSRHNERLKQTGPPSWFDALQRPYR